MWQGVIVVYNVKHSTNYGNVGLRSLQVCGMVAQSMRRKLYTYSNAPVASVAYPATMIRKEPNEPMSVIKVTITH